MSISKEKSIINAFVDISDKVRHDMAVQSLFYGRPSGGRYIENAYVQSIKKAVRLCYSDVKYRGLFKDIYDTYISLFYVYLLAKSEQLSKIETSLAGYLFVTAKNFANDKKVREAIEISIGLSDHSTSVDIDKIIAGLLSNEDGVEPPTEEPIDSPDADSYWAEYLTNKYINSIPNERYRIAIRAIVLEGMPREELAEEFEISYPTGINMLLNHAMTALTNVALPDIRWRSKKNYIQYVNLLENEEDRLLLQDYFENNVYNQGLTLAVRRLIKISIREMREQEAEERRVLRAAGN